MRVVITNFGSTGDIQPCLALAVELRRHGHDVLIATAPDFENLAQRVGLAFQPIGADYQQSIHIANKTMLKKPDDYSQLYALAPLVIQMVPKLVDELRDACRGADLLVGGTLPPVPRLVHEQTGIPFVSLQLSPFTHQNRTLDVVFNSEYTSLWSKLGMAPIEDIMSSGADSPQLALHAVSRHIHPPTSGQPSHYHMPGFFFLDEAGWLPDAALQEFLAAGEPPVVITFGSLLHEDARQLTDLIFDAIERAGCRAIIQHGWSGLAQRALPGQIHAIGFVPHPWLFRHAACVVHHCGAGTTAAVVRAGVPQVCVPHVYDQPTWAELMHRLGCAAPPIPYHHLSAERMAAAIRTILATPRYASVAAEFGPKIQNEQGVQKARQLIEQLMHKLGLQHEEHATAHASIENDQAQRTASRKHYQHQQRVKKRNGATP